jgi:TonB family protein
MRTCIGVGSSLFKWSAYHLGGRRSVIPSALAAIFAALVSFPSRAQETTPVLPQITQNQLTALARRVADQIRKSQIDPAYTKVLVFDFSNQGSKEFTKLGEFLADQFSESLASQANGFVVSDRKLLTANLRDNFVDLKDLRGEGIALELGRSLGASGIIQGDLQEDTDHQLLLTIQLEGFGAKWVSEALFPLTDEMQTLLKEPLPSSAESSRIPGEPNVLRAGLDGVGVPECVYCPAPAYSDTARAAKYQGTIQLSVLVTQDGRAESIFVLKGAPFELNKQAIEAVQKWKFKPAEKNGKPVPVRVPIEISLRID